MSRISRDIYTSLDVNGPYIRIDTQPTSTITEHNQTGTFTLAASIYYLTGDEAEIGDIDVLEADAVAPTDASLDNQTPGVPNRATVLNPKPQGYISYQWYEINEISGETIKLTNDDIYNGVTTNTLTVANTLSPTDHLNRYYCDLDYIPTPVNGEFDTGNAVNDILKSDEVTLNVRPFLIIDTQPISTTTFRNPDSGTTSTKASLSDTRFPWDDYRLEFQWWEVDKENVSNVPNIRLKDGDYSKSFTTNKTVETITNEIQTTVLTESISAGQSKRVGIPTETVDVTFVISGGAGGDGGNEGGSSLGGDGGKSRIGEFKFNSDELFTINNASEPTEYIFAAGTKGSDGRTATSIGGGAGGVSFDLDQITYTDDSANGGRGGNPGPGGISGSGGGGGAGSFVIKPPLNEDETDRFIVIAAGGGGGGGASKDASGVAGEDAKIWKENSRMAVPSDPKQATVVNYNPIAGTGSNPQDKIDYGFYIKSSSPLSTLNTTDTYRIVVIWNGSVVVDEPSARLSQTSLGFSYTNGGQIYYASTYRDSQLGWCNNESNLSTVCVRGDGEYVNTFDVFVDSTYTDEIIPFDGSNGTDKTTGDGGGGGGGGGGATASTTGGNVGKDPIPAVNVDITFKVTQTASRSKMGSSYIEFVEVPWYGFNPDIEPSRGQVVRFNRNSTTQTVSLLTNKTYDVYSSFEDGRTSDSLRILQDFTPDANQGDIIAGRSIGFNLDGGGENIQTGNENDFRDFIVSVSDGTFDISPQTVKLDDGEILGKAIIRFTTPAADINSVSATGGEGGTSQYSSRELTTIVGGNYGLSSNEGGINVSVTTEQPYNTLVETILSNNSIRNDSIRGAHPYTPYKESGYTSNLTITADYALSKRILCQISAIDTSFATRTLARTSFSNTVYTDIVDFIVLDGRNNTITVEGIRHNDNFAILNSNNLDNGDLTIERSGDSSTKEIEYYSFYSNEDIEVDIKLFGGKGNDVNGNAGGEGGFSYVRLNMEANTEYVIAGLNSYVNTPYLFKGGRLLACVGGGGDANVSGPGAPGGGVSMSGGNAYRGGVGGATPDTLTPLTLEGVIGSSSNNTPILPDTKAPIPNGGRTIRCSKGSLFQQGGQPDPCESRGSSVKFITPGGNEVTNTRQISRGFKPGYNILKTGGRNNGAIINRGWGGSGATGGQGSDSFGGGGGSGFIIPDATTDIFVRSEGNAEILASETTLSGLQGTGQDTISSFLGGSTGNAKVVISKAEVASRFLPEFVERPADTDLTVSEEDVIPESTFVPLPEIIPPPPVDPPNPRMSITNVVSKGWTSGNKTYTSFGSNTRINVLESGSLDVNIRTDDIPSNTPFYWEIERITSNSQYTDDDFAAMRGSFRTSVSGGVTVGSFNINPTEDSETDFISGNQDWRFKIYSDSNYNFIVANFNGVITTLDTSLTPPVATFTSLTADGTGSNLNAKTRNSISEGEPARQIKFSTTDIPNGSTVKWYIKHVTTDDADFDNIVSGTEIVTSDFRLDDPDLYAQHIGKSELITANQGTGSFEIRAKEDSSTEGSQFFGLQIEYPVGSGTIIADSTTGTKKHIRILDSSINPGATISGGTSVEEGATLTLTVDTNSIATNSVIYWKIFKSDGITDVDANEFASNEREEISEGKFPVNPTSLNSSFVRLGQETFNIKPAADGLTEPTESFVVKLYRDAARTIALNTPGTSTPSTYTFSVVNTSFSTPVYYTNFNVIKTDDLISGFPQYKETDTAVSVQIEAFHINPLVGDIPDSVVYYSVLNYSEETFASVDNSIGDFDKNKGSFRLDFLGYTNTETPNIARTIVAETDATYFIPYWRKSISIEPKNDYIEDGDKDFEFRFYDTENNRDNIVDDNELTGAAGADSSLQFTVVDDSLPIYIFNEKYGYGVDQIEGSNTLSINKPAGTGKIEEKVKSTDIYSFRLETTALPGTELFYEITPTGFGNKYAENNDFIDPFGSAGKVPFAPSGYKGIRDNGRYYDLNGRVTTFAPPATESGTPGNPNYGQLTIDDQKLNRSIAFIYVAATADKITENEEEFVITVYDDNDFISNNEVVSLQSAIEDTSSRPAVPTITASIDPVTNTGPTGFTINLSTTGAKSGSVTGPSFGLTGIPDFSTTAGSEWWSKSTYTTTGSVGDVTGNLTWKFVVSNDAPGTPDSAEDSVTLYNTITPPPPVVTPDPPVVTPPPTTPPPTTPPPPAATKYSSTRLFRYKKSTDDGTIFHVSDYGPTKPSTDWDDLHGTDETKKKEVKERYGRKLPTKKNSGWQLQGGVGNFYDSANRHSSMDAKLALSSLDGTWYCWSTKHASSAGGVHYKVRGNQKWNKNDYTICSENANGIDVGKKNSTSKWYKTDTKYYHGPEWDIYL